MLIPQAIVQQTGATVVAARKAHNEGAAYTTTSTSFVDVDATDLAITLTTGARRCVVMVVANIENNAADKYTCFDIDVDGSRLGGDFGTSFIQSISADHTMNVNFTVLTDVLSAGSHTFKLQWRVDGGTGKLWSQSGVSPVGFSVLETLATA